MKNAHPHTGKWLRELFPEQAKNIPSIIVWTVIYILDVALIFWLAYLLGIELLQLPYRLQTVIAGIYMIIALGLFWLETVVYNRIAAAIRNRNTLD